jgi:hypothetical protein
VLPDLSSMSAQSSKSSLSSEGIVGLAIGGVGLVALVGFVAYVMSKRHHSSGAGKGSAKALSPRRSSDDDAGFRSLDVVAPMMRDQAPARVSPPLSVVHASSGAGEAMNQPLLMQSKVSDGPMLLHGAQRDDQSDMDSDMDEQSTVLSQQSNSTTQVQRVRNDSDEEENPSMMAKQVPSATAFVTADDERRRARKGGNTGTKERRQSSRSQHERGSKRTKESRRSTEAKRQSRDSTVEHRKQSGRRGATLPGSETSDAGSDTEEEVREERRRERRKMKVRQQLLDQAITTIAEAQAINRQQHQLAMQEEWRNDYLDSCFGVEEMPLPMSPPPGVPARLQIRPPSPRSLAPSPRTSPRGVPPAMLLKQRGISPRASSPRLRSPVADLGKHLP